MTLRLFLPATHSVYYTPYFCYHTLNWTATHKTRLEFSHLQFSSSPLPIVSHGGGAQPEKHPSQPMHSEYAAVGLQATF